MNTPRICYISESLDNPFWSSCNYFFEGLKELCGDKIIGVRHTENIPDGYDWYIDVDSARPKSILTDRDKTCSLIFDLFDTDCDQSWRYEMARNAKIILVTNECSRKKIRDAGIRTECKLISFGIYDKIWHYKKMEKIYDSIFVGNIKRKSAKRRRNFIDIIKHSGYNIRYLYNCFMERYADFLNQSKIGIEIPNEGYDNFGIRAMEIIGCGIPLLTIKDDVVAKILPEELVTYYDPTLESFVERYNMVYNDLENKTKAAMKLNEYFMQKFTYRHVAERIIKALNGEYNETEMFCS